MIVRLIIACLCAVTALPAAQYYAAPGATAGDGSLANAWALQIALTNSSLSPGDTIWLRGGTYIPTATNVQSMGSPCWSLAISGATNNLITLRSYPNEWAKIDRQWRIGSGITYMRFRDLEFYDSYKGSNPTNVSYPNGPWAHIDGPGAVSGSGHEWINCVVHDVNNFLSGSASGHSMRGCIIWYVGLNGSEHVVYNAPDEFTGNIIGWTARDSVNLTPPTFLAQSNIMFGTGQTIGGVEGSGDFRLNSTTVSELSFNYIYNRFASNVAHTSIEIESGSGAANINSNVIAVCTAVKFRGTTAAMLSGNTLRQASQFAAYPIIHRYDFGGTWAIDNNRYTSQSPQPVAFEDQGVAYRTFAEWRTAFPAFDANSTSTNSAVPPDAVHVIPNQDQSKRAHIAIYNWTSANNVVVSLAGVLISGDTYQLYSAQNYNGGAIQTGTYNGTSISVPMTNLVVAPVLYSTNWNLLTPPLTSPEFAAFVVTGSGSAINATTANIGIINAAP